MYRRLARLTLAALLSAILSLNLSHWEPTIAGAPAPVGISPQSTIVQRPSDRPAPRTTIDPYVRPSFAHEMQMLRPSILEAARRHNRTELSNMTDREFAVVIALILYNENFGSLEDRVSPLRPLTPFYQRLQVGLNEVGGSNLSVWPANLRPSVALEILQHQVPVPAPTRAITEPIQVAGSDLDITAYDSREALYTALTQEIAEPHMAVEYLAANLERGLYRAQFEGVPVTWRALAAWHNQGIVSPANIRHNPTARDYLRRSSAYLAQSYALIDGYGCPGARCKIAHRDSSS